jgi:hypothetical protein
MECPKCGAEIGKSTYCGCGWSRAGNAHANSDRLLGYQQCDWNSDGERCRYPGSISPHPGKGGPWYCRMHFGCEDMSFGAEVVIASRDYKHESNEEKRNKNMAEAEAFCLAQGLKTVADKRAWLKKTLGNLGRKRPKDREAA